MEDGCAQVNGFLGDFFIRKCMWSTPAAIRQYCASLQKFYKSMLGAGLIQQTSYDQLLDETKYGKEEWCDRCEAFNGARSASMRTSSNYSRRAHPPRSHFHAGTWTMRFPSRSSTASAPRPTMSVASSQRLSASASHRARTSRS